MAELWHNARSTLLQKYSAHLRTHGHLIIGLALILLGILELKQYLVEPWESSVCLLLGLNVYRGYLFYFCIFVASSAFWFVLMRHFVYGILIDTTIEACLDKECKKKEQKKDECQKQKTALQELMEEVRCRVKKRRILEIIPYSWFYGRSLRRITGLILCFILGILTTLVMYTLLG